MSRTPTRSRRTRIVHLGLAATAVAVGLGGLTVAPASAATPKSELGDGEVHLTSATETALGTTLSYAGTGFGLNDGAGQTISVKIDDGGYTPASGEDVVGTANVQGDGTISGNVTVPDDLTADSGTDDGEHWLRYLGSTPVVSKISDYFTVSDDASAAPTVTASAVTSTGRSSGVTVTLTGSGFTAGDSIAVTDGATGDAYTWTTGGTVDDDGNLTGTIKFAIGDYPAGEHQLVLTGSDADNPGVAQVTVDPAISFTGLAVSSTGTVTVSNLQPGATFDSVTLDPDSTVDDDEIEILDADFTADDTGTATGSVTVPAGEYLGTKTFTVTQSLPYGATYTASAKVSPSTATSGESGYARVASATGAVAQGLYQSAYSSQSDALFATAAFSGTNGWDGYLYKLDPDTLKVESSVEASEVTAGGARYAPYGVGVDDTNGTVWVTNTRQNTVAVYSQDDLSLLQQWTGTDSTDANGYVNHPRDVVADPADGYVFVSSASEGSSGDGYISVFESDDQDGDGVKYEKIEDIAVHARTEFSPMSLELDAEDGKLFTVSSTTAAAMVIDTKTLEDTIIDVDGLVVDGSRGASGVAYDADSNRLFIASQNTDEVVVAQLNDDLTESTTIKELAAGAGSLNVAFDPVHELAYVANFSGTTITVLDTDGNRVANLGLSKPNHLAEDGQGSVYAVNKDTDNQVVKLTPKVTSAKPTVTGTAKVGKKLTAKPGSWTSGTTLAYQWKRNGTAIKGATKATYTAVAADAGKKITVTVTGAASGYASASATSAAKKVAKGTLSGTKPKVKGKAKVGKKLVAKHGTWTTGTKLTYQWLANGKKIKGATKAKLKLTKKLSGKRISVKVTGTKTGYTTLAKTSATTAKVKKK
ncbi:MAG: hypothetical protein QM638_07200 [Nocardioides sp.]|uniref:hypothetical protein n=1 Tax=Nocardioides sp. TaxID=35761 RepID=UPI0039E2C96D